MKTLQGTLAQGIACACLLGAIAFPSFAQSSKTLLDELPMDEIQKIVGAYSIIQTDYVKSLPPATITASCLHGMLEELDPYSSYLEQEQYTQLREAPGQPPGIGVQLILRAGLPMVMAKAEGSPAERAGMRAKDYILEIDGQSTEELDLASVVKKLTGPAGSSVSIVVRSIGQFESRPLTLKREAIALPGVLARNVAPGIAYLRVGTFTERTAPQIREQFKLLDSQEGKGLHGLILDMRDSPGGPLPTVIEIAAMFLQPDAVIGYTAGRLPESNQTFRANRDEILTYHDIRKDAWPPALKTVPLVVLVNQGTSAGGEIVSAALRDNGRAKLLGTRTFGRGTVQTFRGLSSHSAIKLTTAVYKTPNGRQFDRTGLTPDVDAPDTVHPQDAGSAKDAALGQAIALLK